MATGSDRTIQELKGRAPVNTEMERKYMLEALRHVKGCAISRGSDIMDFTDELKRVSPEFFIVNEDGNTPAKAQLCKDLGLKYVVLQRDFLENCHSVLPQACGRNVVSLIASTWPVAGSISHSFPNLAPARC